MIIGIDVRVLGSPIKSGIEEYAENLIPHLVREGKDIQFKLFYSSHKQTLPDFDWLGLSNVKLYKFNYSGNFLFTFSRVFNRPLMDKMVGGADIFFFPHFFISSLSPNCKRVTTFHDLSYVHFPEYLTLRKKIWHNFQMNPKWQAKFSDKIIAVSESTKKDLINFYRIDPARIEVIYSGLTSDVANFKKSKNIPDRFILFLGKLEPRKNVISIVRAFNMLKEDPKYNDLCLVIVGAKGWLFDDILKETKTSVHKNQVIFTGQLNDEEKFSYYRAADIFIYPSFFEGFGFPPLEAMSCGTPVITSRNSSLPEVVGRAAIMIDPFDIDELRLWITKLLDDRNLSDVIAKKGVKQASKFNWQNAAIKTLGVLKIA